MTFIARLFGGLLSRIFAVVLAVSAVQLPVYYDQYLQTLGGARQEASLRYQELLREAQALQLTVEAFVVRHEQNSDPVFQASGRIHRSTLARYLRLNTAWQALSAAAVVQKPAMLLRFHDPDVAAGLRFSPGLLLTPEAGAYALAGIVLAWLLTTLLGALLLPGQQGAPAGYYFMPPDTKRREPVAR